MTPYSKVYEAFLSKILEDEWGNWTINEMEIDLHQIMLAAIPYFKFPRVSLDARDEVNQAFEGDLSNEEIQIIASYMKCEWLNRSIMTWENIRPMYSEKDFSPANLLDKLNQTLITERKNALRMESYYYRSIKGKPYDYSQWGSRIE